MPTTPDPYAAYSNEELLDLGPGALRALTPERLATFGNDIFMQYPDLMPRLSPADRASRLRSLPNEFFLQNPSYYSQLTPEEIKARGFAPGITPQASGAPTYPGLEAAGVVPPRVKAGLKPLAAGGPPGRSPYLVDYTGAGIRRPSAQTFYGGMNPTDREMTLATFEAVGLEPEDVVSDIQGPGRGGQKYYAIGERPRRPNVRY